MKVFESRRLKIADASKKTTLLEFPLRRDVADAHSQGRYFLTGKYIEIWNKNGDLCVYKLRPVESNTSRIDSENWAKKSEKFCTNRWSVGKDESEKSKKNRMKKYAFWKYVWKELQEARLLVQNRSVV